MRYIGVVQAATDCGSCADVAVSSPNAAEISQLVASRVPGRSLSQPFYTSPSLYETEMATVWRSSWLFAGYSFQIPSPGDFFTFEVGRDSVIIVRGDDSQIRALHNTCRHRSAPLCSCATVFVGVSSFVVLQGLAHCGGSQLGQSAETRVSLPSMVVRSRWQACVREGYACGLSSGGKRYCSDDLLWF